MTEDYGDRFERHERMLEGLAKLWQRQGEINEEQRAINERLVAAIERLDATQADIKQLLATLIERGTNGRGA
jgi:translation initiation factor 1 (eIF-1/SUI1)